MALPKPPSSLGDVKNTIGELPEKDHSGELTQNESSYILDITLNKRNRKNPTVIRFIEEFVRCKSISEASIECNISPREGYMIRHRPDVANAIKKIWEKSTTKYGFDASEIFERVKEVVDFDPVMVMNQDGTFKSNLHDIPAAARRNLKKLKAKNLYNQVEDINGVKRKIIIGEVIEYEFYDKLKAAELAGKEKEMFKNTTKVEHDVTKDMKDVLLASAKRAEERRLPESVPTIVDAEVIDDR